MFLTFRIELNENLISNFHCSKQVSKVFEFSSSSIDVITSSFASILYLTKEMTIAYCVVGRQVLEIIRFFVPFFPSSKYLHSTPCNFLKSKITTNPVESRDKKKIRFVVLLIRKKMISDFFSPPCNFPLVVEDQGPGHLQYNGNLYIEKKEKLLLL